MAMPTRSARTTEFGTNAPTPVTVGPGSYLRTQQATKTRPLLAAFASSEHRSYQGTPSTPSGPGPGSYIGLGQTAQNENDWRPSYCFESRAPRLAPQYTGSTPFGASSIVEVPGPGTYETTTTTSTAPGRFTQRGNQRIESRQNTVPTAAKRFNPPSVPRREQSFGYNVDCDGQLLALPPPFPMRTGSRADCAGPGDYNPEDRDYWCGHGGVKFSKGSRKTVFEQEWIVKDMRPGPGDYSPKPRPQYHLEMPGSSAFMSGVPKGADVRYQGGPGPGQYAHQSPFSANPSASNVALFSSSAQRGVWLRSEKCPFSEPESGHVPGPGAYGGLQDYSSFNKPIPKRLTDEKIGFSSTGRRATSGPNSHTRDMPGPGQYDIDGQSIAGCLKHKGRIGCKGVFGSTGDRFRPKNRNEANIKETPMNLWDQGKVLKRVVVLRHVPKSTSSFKSDTGRFRTDRAATSPATQYMIKDSFDQIVEKGAKSKIRSFSSTSQRFDGGVFDLKDVGDRPGPGAYNVDTVKTAVPLPRSRAQLTSRLPQCARFGSNGVAPKSTVGPGSHEIAGSFIKKTFNVTFGGACVPAGAGRVAHRVFQISKLKDCDIQLVGLPTTRGAEEPAFGLDSLGQGGHTVTLQSATVPAAA